MRCNNKDKSKSLLTLQLETMKSTTSVMTTTGFLAPEDTINNKKCDIEITDSDGESIIHQTSIKNLKLPYDIDTIESFLVQEQQYPTTTTVLHNVSAVKRRYHFKDTLLLSTSPPCSTFSFQKMKLAMRYDYYGSPPTSLCSLKTISCGTTLEPKDE